MRRENMDIERKGNLVRLLDIDSDFIICGLGGISLQKWYKWFTPLFLILFLAQAVLVGIAAGIGY